MPPPRVLVVEDESFVRALIVDKLAAAGFDVDQARDSDAALQLIEADGYSLLVTETNMRGNLSGAELAKHANENKPGLPVIFVAARAGATERLRRGGIEAVELSHPFAIDELVSLVHGLTVAARDDVTASPTENDQMSPASAQHLDW